MAGHSQYANIKHRKDAQDNKRGKIFQKLSKFRRFPKNCVFGQNSVVN